VRSSHSCGSDERPRTPDGHGHDALHQTTDPGASSRLWTQVDREITDQAPWISFVNGVVLEVKSNRVGNYQYNPQWGTLLDQLWVRLVSPFVA
jgi:hypothetical protein